VAASDVVGAGITNQREDDGCLDARTGDPIAPAIVWPVPAYSGLLRPTRGIAPGARESNKNGPRDRRLLFGKQDSLGFSKTRPGARRRAQNGDLLFGNIDTWLIWKLTDGAGACDRSIERLARTHAHESGDGRLGRRSAAHYSKSRAPCSHASFRQACVAGEMAAAPRARFPSRSSRAIAGGVGRTGVLFAPVLNRTAGMFRAAAPDWRVPVSSTACSPPARLRRRQPDSLPLKAAVFIAGRGIQWVRDETEKAIVPPPKSGALAAYRAENN